MEKLKTLFKFLTRMRILILFFLFISLVLISRLYMLQIVNGEAYEEEADRQYFAAKDVFNRGKIFFEDKNGEQILAGTLKLGFNLVINPNFLEKPEEAYEKLIELGLVINKETFLIKAKKENDPYEEIVSQIDAVMAEKIKNLDIEGVILEKTKWRFYPSGNLASHVLGFVGYAGDSQKGLYGVEKHYDYILQRSEKDLNKNFFADIFSNLGDIILGNQEKREGDIILTIEPSVQLNLEEELEKLAEKWKADLSGGIIINPQNGEIYAMALNPNFDLNNKRAEGVFFGNPLVEGVYEMGSIIKALTMAMGLDLGVVSAETVYNDTGFLVLNESRISNYDGRARGLVDMQEVLNQSLNVGAAFVERQVGNEKFAQYLSALGLGEETGIDLPGETRGFLTELIESPRDIEYATASYGQGVAFTPIGTVKALATLANGGFLITPHLVKEIDYCIGTSDKIFYKNDVRVFKEETSKEITRMLKEVVDDALLGGVVKSENYTIAAKTGTAQMIKEDGTGYDKDKYLHSFFGYFPTAQPQFLIFLYALNPKEIDYASHTLTEPFINMFKFLVNYYEVEPDR